MRVSCVGIDCRKVFEVQLGRGRPRFFHVDGCRLRTYRKVREKPELQKILQGKKDAITRQYREARKSSMSSTGMRKRAMITLSENGWSDENIGKVFGVGDERVRQIIGRKDDDGATGAATG